MKSLKNGCRAKKSHKNLKEKHQTQLDEGGLLVVDVLV